MSTYSPSLRITLIDDGEQTGTWGDTTNANLGDIIEQAITGYIALAVDSATKVLVVNNAVDEARNAVISLTQGAVATNFAVFVPPVEKLYVFNNQTNFNATIYCSSVTGNTTPRGIGIVIPAAGIIAVYSDGTNIVTQSNYTPGGFAVGGGIAVSGSGLIGGALSVTGQISGNVTGNVTGNTTGLHTGSVAAGAGTISTTTFSFTEVSNVLYIKSSGTNVAKIDASGNLTVLGNVTAYGTV